MIRSVSPDRSMFAFKNSYNIETVAIGRLAPWQEIQGEKYHTCRRSPLIPRKSLDSMLFASNSTLNSYNRLWGGGGGGGVTIQAVKQVLLLYWSLYWTQIHCLIEPHPPCHRQNYFHRDLCCAQIQNQSSIFSQPP